MRARVRAELHCARSAVFGGAGQRAIAVHQARQLDRRRRRPLVPEVYAATGSTRPSVDFQFVLGLGRSFLPAGPSFLKESQMERDAMLKGRALRAMQQVLANLAIAAGALGKGNLAIRAGALAEADYTG